MGLSKNIPDLTNANLYLDFLHVHQYLKLAKKSHSECLANKFTSPMIFGKTTYSNHQLLHRLKTSVYMLLDPDLSFLSLIP